MRFTKNEKRVLNLLVDNSKLSDTTIAQKLKISSQAIGRIRKKLENTVIKNYTLDLDLSKMGVSIFVLARARLTSDGLKLGKEKAEERIINEPYIIAYYEIFEGAYSYIISTAFKDMTELKNFFHSMEKRENLHRFIKIDIMHSIPYTAILKNCPKSFLHKIINETGVKNRYVKNKHVGFTDTRY